MRPANDEQRDPDGVPPERWLFAEWPVQKDEPVKYWLSDLPDQTPIMTLAHLAKLRRRLAKLRRRVEHDYPRAQAMPRARSLRAVLASRIPSETD